MAVSIGDDYKATARVTTKNAMRELREASREVLSSVPLSDEMRLDWLTVVDFAHAALLRIADLATDGPIIGDVYARYCAELGDFFSHFEMLTFKSRATESVLRLVCTFDEKVCEWIGI